MLDWPKSFRSRSKFNCSPLFLEMKDVAFLRFCLSTLFAPVSLKFSVIPSAARAACAARHRQRRGSQLDKGSGSRHRGPPVRVKPESSRARFAEPPRRWAFLSRATSPPTAFPSEVSSSSLMETHRPEARFGGKIPAPLVDINFQGRRDEFVERRAARLLY